MYVGGSGESSAAAAAEAAAAAAAVMMTPEVAAALHTPDTAQQPPQLPVVVPSDELAAGDVDRGHRGSGHSHKGQCLWVCGSVTEFALGMIRDKTRGFMSGLHKP